jgi:hypothetical protein
MQALALAGRRLSCGLSVAVALRWLALEPRGVPVGIANEKKRAIARSLHVRGTKPRAVWKPR